MSRYSALSLTEPPTARRSARRPLRLVALTAIAAIAVTLGVTAVAATPAVAATAPVVSLTFDDANADQMPAAATLASKGLTGTFFINSGFLNQPGYMTTANLATLAAAGNEIGGHTRSHPDLVQVPADEATRQICNDRVALTALGYSVTSFAYPFASANPAIEAIAAGCGYNSARGLGDLRTAPGTPCADCDFAETMPPQDPFWTRAADQVDSTWTLAQLQSTITNASVAGGWVQLTFHHICDGCDNLAISTSVFDQFTTWLQGQVASASVVVKTVGAVIGGAVKPTVPGPIFVPPAPAGPGVNALQNPSFEEIAADGIPRCWWDSVFGINTATFSTVSPGRTGTKAAQVTVSGFTSGDAKRLQLFDGGACAPTVVPGQTYSLRAWYQSTGNTQFTVYYRLTDGSWIYGTSSPWFGPATAYTSAVWTTPAMPANVNGISFALNVFTNGTLTVDDYSMYNTVGAPALDLIAPTPTITGTPRIRSVLTAVPGTWGPSPVALSYQWFAGGVAISGATGTSYSPRIKDLGKQITVQVTGAKAGFATTMRASAATTPVTVLGSVRLSGADRYSTSAMISAATFDPGVPVAYITTGTNFPDALSGGAAGGKSGGPVLLVTPTAVPQVVHDELVRLQPARIVVLGGTQAISASVATALAQIAPTSRLSGSDRYETSASISAATFPSGVPVAYISTGENFPDALAGGAAAGSLAAPVLLVSHTAIPAGIATELARLKPLKIVVLGGPNAIAESVVQKLKLIAPTTRISGADRYATASGISTAVFAPGVPTVYLATGENFPDALSGSAAAVLEGAPVLLVSANSIPASSLAELARLKPHRVVALGGTAAISDAVMTQAQSYVQ